MDYISFFGTQLWHLNTPNCQPILRRTNSSIATSCRDPPCSSRAKWSQQSYDENRGNGGEDSPYKMRWSICKRRNGPLRLNDMTKKNNGHFQELWHEISDWNYMSTTNILIDSFWRLPGRVTIDYTESTLRNRKDKATVPLKSHHRTNTINCWTPKTVVNVLSNLQQLAASNLLRGNLDLFTSSTPTFISMTQMVVIKIPFSTERTTWVQKLELFSSQISYPSLHNSQ